MQERGRPLLERAGTTHRLLLQRRCAANSMLYSVEDLKVAQIKVTSCGRTTKSASISATSVRRRLNGHGSHETANDTILVSQFKTAETFLVLSSMCRTRTPSCMCHFFQQVRAQKSEFPRPTNAASTTISAKPAMATMRHHRCCAAVLGIADLRDSRNHRGCCLRAVRECLLW